MASIIDYLIYLAHNPDAAQRHNSGEDAARAEMSKYGLDAGQQDTILSRNHYEIADAASAEVQPEPMESLPGTGNGIVYPRGEADEGEHGRNS